MGSMTRRLRKAVTGRFRNRVAFDFETMPIFGQGKTWITAAPYEYRQDLEGPWRRGPHPDIVFLDESDRIRDRQRQAIHIQERLDRVAGSMGVRRFWPDGTFLAVDPGAEPGVVVFHGEKVVR